MSALPKHLQKKIVERAENGTLRKLVDFSDYTDFFSNDYLGIARQKFPSSDFSEGSTGSRLISGNSMFTEKVEVELALFYGYEAGLIFNSGFDANLGIYSCIPQRGDTVIFDELCHASIRDGLRLNFAEKESFKHNDLKDLERLLSDCEGQVYVAIESLYSMDGDQAPIVEIVALCRKYNALLILDEAHSAGVFGENGKGLSEEQACDDGIFIKLVTFGKAYGSHGAIALCDYDTRIYLLNYARSFIYTTALPQSSVYRIQQAVQASIANELDRTLLQNNIAFFITQMLVVKPSFKPNSSPIQIIEYSNTEVLVEKVAEANKHKLAVKAIMAPTVAKGKERIRVCLHSFNTPQKIQELIKILA